MKVLIALAALGFIILSAFDSTAIQASTPNSKIKTVTKTETVTSTVTTACRSITGPAGRIYCGPLFELLGYSIVAHTNTASFRFLDMYTETLIDSAQFYDQSSTYSLTCRSSGITGNVFDLGQIVICSGSGFSPAITTSSFDYGMQLSVNNPGDTELFLTQSWSASFLTVTP